MRKKHLLIVSIASIILLACTGCSSVPKEKVIKEDLENYSESELLKKGEKIDEIVIDKRETDKDRLFLRARKRMNKLRNNVRFISL